jgi:hypothetical protein
MRNPTWDAAVLDAKRICAAVRHRECYAYLFADGFDNYNSAAQLYDSVTGTITYSSGFARFAPPAGLPGQGIKFASGGARIIKNLIRNEATLIIKVAINFASLGSSSINPFLGALDAGTFQWNLCVTPSGALGVIKGASGATQVVTGPGVVTTGLWYGIEILVTINGAASTATVWVNGFQVINATPINCQATANAFAGQVAVGDINGNGLVNMLADDFRVWDNTGGTQNAPIGIDSRLVTKLPSGAGANTNFTPNGAAANWQCVDDNPPDDDTSYVSGAAAGLLDSYAMPSAGFTVAPVGGVVSRSRVRKDDGAVRSIQIGVQSGGGSNASGAATVGSTYAFIDGCSPFDPNTTLVWTAAGADAAQHWKQETA